MEGNDLLYDHYKESFSLSKEAQSRRNKYFLILCLLEALSFGFLTNPQMVIELFNKGIKSYLEITLPFEIHILQTLLWVLVIYVLIRYIQDVLYIERQYGYLEKLEKEIDCILGKRKIFCREGLAYRDEYPMVLNIITLFYKTMMPLLFTGINTVRIIIEWRTAKVVTISLVCDTILYTAIFVIIWFFFFEMHPKITRFAKKYIPLVDIIDTYIRKMLKEV